MPMQLSRAEREWLERLGRKPKPKPTRPYRYVDVDKLTRLWQQGESIEEISRRFGSHRSTVSKYVNILRRQQAAEGTDTCGRRRTRRK